jgi:hypothetical protein
MEERHSVACYHYCTVYICFKDSKNDVLAHFLIYLSFTLEKYMHLVALTRRFFWIFLCMYFIQHCFICRLPSDSTVSEDAGIEPRTVATSALAVRRSSYSAILLYQIRRPLGLVFVIYFWWLGELLLLYI